MMILGMFPFMLGFNPRACMRRDAADRAMTKLGACFNPRACMRRDLLDAGGLADRMHVSIHAPA